jgi:hypothetical protein
MSTHSEHEAILRRALHAAANGIEPQGDGLQRIQARLRPPRPIVVAWAEAAWLDTRMRVPAILEAGLKSLRSALLLAWERFGPSRTTSGRATRNLSWLRPAAALGVTVFIVAAGAYVAIDAQQAIFPSSISSGNSGGGGAGPGVSPSGTANLHSPSTGSSIGSHPSPSTSASCRPARPAASGKPSTSTSTGQTSTSPSSSPTDSPTPAGSPTSGATDTPSGGATSAGLSTAAPLGPSTANSAAAAVTQVDHAALAGSTVSRTTSTRCGRTRTPRNQSSPTLHPSGQPAVVSFGKLDGGS